MSTTIDITTANGTNTVITSDVSPVTIHTNQDGVDSAIENDYEVLDYTHGYILHSPGGMRGRITMNDDYTLNVTAL